MKLKAILSIFLAAAITFSTFVPAAAQSVSKSGNYPSSAQADSNSDFVIEDGVLVEYKGAGGNVAIPDGVTSIGYNVFYFCESLTGVTIPNSVKTIEDHAFDYCFNLTSVVIPDSVTSIGDYAFYGDEYGNLSKLASVTIPSSVTSIGISAFDGTPWLENYPNDFVVVGDKILILYKGTATNVTIPNDVKSIGSYAFYGCETMTSVTMPQGVTSIGEGAFGGCYNIASIELPDSVTSIGDFAFNCYNEDGKVSKLATVTIPGSVTSIGFWAFGETPWLNDYPGDFVIVGNKILIKYKGTNTNISVPGDVKSIGAGAFWNCFDVLTVIIPTGVTSIGMSAFESCGITDIIIPDSVLFVDDHAFANCNSLKSITISKNVTAIGYCEFCNCTSLTSITIPDSVNVIDDEAFYGCKSLTTITIPSGVTNIGNNVFEDCSKLIQINVAAGNKDFSSSGGVLFDKLQKNLILCPIGKKGSYSIPATVTSIGNKAFYSCTGLTGVTIPNGVKTIGISAFEACFSLTSVVIPGSVTSIGDYAFFGLNDDGDSSRLANVIIPSSVTSIGYAAFNGTAWIDNYPGDFVVVGNHILICYKGSAANVTIPGSVTSIGDAFYDLDSLASVIIPSSVTKIGYGAFESCQSLKKLTIPGSVTSIDDEAISDCNEDLRIYCPTGSAALTYAKDNEIPYTIVVFATKVTLSASTLKLAAGKTATLTATFSPNNTTTKTVTWLSSKTSVATVDSTGKVKAIGVGTAVITCTAKDGSLKTATCTISVIPATPTNPKAASASYNSIKISWTAVSGVTGYAVYRSATSAGTYSYLAKTTSTSYTNTSLSTAKTYYYKIYAYKTVNGSNVYSAPTAAVNAKPVPAIPGSLTAVKASSTSIKTSWNTVAGANGYEVYMASSSTGSYSLIRTTTSTSFTKTGLTKNHVYYFKVRAYKTVSGAKVFGAYTAIKSAKPY